MSWGESSSGSEMYGELLHQQDLWVKEKAALTAELDKIAGFAGDALGGGSGTASELVAKVCVELDLLKREKQDECDALRAALEHEAKSHLETCAELDRVRGLLNSIASNDFAGDGTSIKVRYDAESESFVGKRGDTLSAGTSREEAIIAKISADLMMRSAKLAAVEADCLSVTRGNVELMQECVIVQEQMTRLEADGRRLDWCDKELVISYPSSKPKDQTLRQYIDTKMREAAATAKAPA